MLLAAALVRPILWARGGLGPERIGESSDGVEMAEIGVAITTAVLIIVGVVAFRWAKALEQLRRSVAALGEGKPMRPILSQVGGPAGRLIRLFNEVAPRLEGRIAQLEQDRRQF